MGVRHGEMKDVVTNTISIDEYTPKLGQNHEIIVVAFFVVDELAAYDLDDFIDKSTIELLDSEVSPYPNQDGEWAVFIEFKRHSGFWIKFLRLVKDIENLTTPRNWMVSLYKQPKKLELSGQQVRDELIVNSDQYQQKYGQTTIREHFQDSVLDNFQIHNNVLVFEKNKNQLEFELVNQGGPHSLWENYPLKNAHWDPSQTSNRAFLLERWLGSNWRVESIDQYVVVTNQKNNVGYVLK